MRAYLITLLSLVISAQLRAQKVEVYADANAGLFHYAGKSTTSTSFFNSAPNNTYTNNPYGNKNGFSYGGAVRAQYVGKSGFIAGLQTGYEILRSKVDITRVYPLMINLYYGPAVNYAAAVPYASKGEVFLQNSNINMNPYIGYRIKTKTVKIDLLPGIDLGFNIKSYDKGKATVDDGTVYKVDQKRTNAPTDIRLRFGIAASFRRTGITASVAHGLTNYESRVIGDAAYEAHSELLRFGITYKLF
ncbi:hypothetical protein BH09BAC6_BH09BAC6_30310 [soil metagenome]|jgi:hypothetical protein